MAKHELVCIRAHIIPAQTLGPIELVAACTGERLGTVGEPLTIPEDHVPVGRRAVFTRKADALRFIRTGNWEYVK